MRYKKEDEIREYAIDFLKDSISENSGYGADLHNEIFNTDYYIIGTYEAGKWLEGFSFEAIGVIKEYEQDNFGESYTDLSCPEKVVNMYVYIVGESILCESKTLQENWNNYLTNDDINNIVEELS